MTQTADTPWFKPFTRQQSFKDYFQLDDLTGQPTDTPGVFFKDGAYFCYCAYVLRISRYSSFLWVVPTNSGIFLRPLKLCGESRT